MTAACCFDCRFFAPDHRTCNDLTEDEWDECLPGECRRRCPALGPMVTDRYGDEQRHFGEWPKVLASDWCGEFQKRCVVQAAEASGQDRNRYANA